MLNFTPTAGRTKQPRLFFACAKAAQPRSRCGRATVLRGAVLANDSDVAREARFVLLDRTCEVTLEANNDATAKRDLLPREFRLLEHMMRRKGWYLAAKCSSERCGSTSSFQRPTS
jgi:DNA-binding response OmpR family regulator